jgi:hypothetical protein
MGSLLMPRFTSGGRERRFWDRTDALNKGSLHMPRDAGGTRVWTGRRTRWTKHTCNIPGRDLSTAGAPRSLDLSEAPGFSLACLVEDPRVVHVEAAVHVFVAPRHSGSLLLHRRRRRSPA